MRSQRAGRARRVDHLCLAPLGGLREDIHHPAAVAERPVRRDDRDGLRQPLRIDRLQHPLERLGTDDHVDPLAGGHELLGEEIQGRGAVALRHQQAVRQAARMREPLAQRADHVEEGVGARGREPRRPRPRGIDHELQRARPPPATGRVVDREMAPEQELPSLRHLDGDELSRPRLLGDLGRHDRELVIRPELARREHLGADALHATPVPRARAWPASKPSRSWTGRALTPAWCSWIDLGSVVPASRASIPRTAANAPGIVVRQGTPAAAAAVRMW